MVFYFVSLLNIRFALVNRKFLVVLVIGLITILTNSSSSNNSSNDDNDDNDDGCLSYVIRNDLTGRLRNCPELEYNSNDELIRNPILGCEINLNRGDFRCGQEGDCYSLSNKVRVYNRFNNKITRISLAELSQLNENEYLIEVSDNYFESYWFSHVHLKDKKEFLKITLDYYSNIILTKYHNIILRNGTQIPAIQASVEMVIKGNKKITKIDTITDIGFANIITENGEFLIYSGRTKIASSCFSYGITRVNGIIFYSLIKPFKFFWLKIDFITKERRLKYIGSKVQNFLVKLLLSY